MAERTQLVPATANQPGKEAINRQRKRFFLSHLFLFWLELLFCLMSSEKWLQRCWMEKEVLGHNEASGEEICQLKWNCFTLKLILFAYQIEFGRFHIII
jgi:hypothetical protein